MMANTKPVLTFNLVEKVDPETYLVTFLVVNFEGEIFNSFADHEGKKAFDVWMSYLTQDEKTQWDNYILKCEAQDEVWHEQQCERMHFSYN
jgi:hypothetical protein